MIISLTTQLSVRDRKPALSPLTFRNITSGQGAQSLLSTAATPDKMLLILICILRLGTQRLAAVSGQPAIKAVMGLLGNLKLSNQGPAGKLVHEKLSITCRAGGACPERRFAPGQLALAGAHTIIRRVSSRYLLCTCRWSQCAYNDPR